MVYKFRPGKSVIAKVFRDMGIQRSDWVNDAVEWMGEALDHIGTPGQTVDKARIVKTSSHRAPLPKDLYYIKSVRYGTGTDSDTKISDLTLEDFGQYMKYGNPDGHPALIEESDSASNKATLGVNETFLISGGYIRTSFDSDYIAIFYKAFAVDDDGFPLIPDSAAFSEALYWYIRMKLLGRGETDPAGFGYGDAEQRWLKYAGQARSDANMPDEPKMKAFRDMWTRLVPEWNRDLRSLSDKTLGLEELQDGLIETRPLTT